MGTKSTSWFNTHLWNELDFVPFAYEDAYNDARTDPNLRWLFRSPSLKEFKSLYVWKICMLFVVC